MTNVSVQVLNPLGSYACVFTVINNLLIGTFYNIAWHFYSSVYTSKNSQPYYAIFCRITSFYEKQQ